MASKVDVLGVLDYAAEAFGQHGWNASANSLVESRAAVAELIRHADTLATVVSNLIAARQVDERYGAHVTDLTSALANVGGA